MVKVPAGGYNLVKSRCYRWDSIKNMFLRPIMVPTRQNLPLKVRESLPRHQLRQLMTTVTLATHGGLGTGCNCKPGSATHHCVGRLTLAG